MLKEASVKKKIGIMGGTFNPIHNGHLLMAQTAAEEFSLNEVWFIPTGLQWMKKDNPDLLSPSFRYEMTEAAISDNEAFAISDIEIKRQGNTYTYETLEALHAQIPEAEWYYIVGADTLSNMEKWVHPEKVFALSVILCAVRGEQDQSDLEALSKMLMQKYDADIRLMKMARIDLSSTDIRNRVREGKSIRYMVPDKVRSYIEKNSLYQTL